MVENKVAFLSGKLSGTKTIEKEFEAIENPDEYETRQKTLLYGPLERVYKFEVRHKSR